MQNDNDIHRYITTFALRKMWDDSWKVLEHPEFTDKPYYDMDTEEDTKKALNSFLEYKIHDVKERDG